MNNDITEYISIRAKGTMSGESPLHRQLKGDRSLFDPGQQVGRPNLNPSTQIHRTMGPSDDGNFFLGHSRNRDLWVQSEGHSLDGVEDLLGLIQLLAHFPRPNRPNPKLFGLRCCTDPTIACAASVPSRSSRTHRPPIIGGGKTFHSCSRSVIAQIKWKTVRVFFLLLFF